MKNREYLFERRKIDYTVRDLSHIGTRTVEKKRFSIFLTLILLLIVSGSVLFFIYSFPEFSLKESNEIYDIDNGYVQKKSIDKKGFVEKELNDEYYKIEIAMKTEKKLSRDSLIRMNSLQNRLANSNNLRTLSLADYILELNLLANEDYSIPPDEILRKLAFSMESAGFNIDNFVSSDYSKLYLYVKKNRTKKLEDIKEKLIITLKNFSSSKRVRISADFNRSAGKIIPVMKLKVFNGIVRLDR